MWDFNHGETFCSRHLVETLRTKVTPPMYIVTEDFLEAIVETDSAIVFSNSKCL